MIHTRVNHEYNGDGTKRKDHCCGCFYVIDFGPQEMIFCNECGEARPLLRTEDPDAAAVVAVLDIAGAL